MRYPYADIDDVEDDIRQTILDVAEKSGFVPNVFLSLARRPAEFRAFFAYYDALMEKETGNLTKADREMIVMATSAINHCLYCVVAHGADAADHGEEAFVADVIAINYRQADIIDRQMAMLDFADHGLRQSPGHSPTLTSRPWPSTDSTTRTPGTSAPSPDSSACPTAWHTSAE